MKTIFARNVNDALSKGINLINEEGKEIPSRNGPTIEIPCPVATVYERPWERVLISSVRDANPFFHLMEALWIIAGREDVKFLTEFNSRMSDYSDDGIKFNAPYGYRMRHKVSQSSPPVDQISNIIHILKTDPKSRQAVAQIWDVNDLTKNTKDKACNMECVFRIRKGKLCLTVYNRSNDMIWGAYGANMVQFSMLQEYVAAHIGIPMGEYTQITNSYHVYTSGPGGELWGKLKNEYEDLSTLYDTSIVSNISMLNEKYMSCFEYDLKQFFCIYDNYDLREISEMKYSTWASQYFRELVLPMLSVFTVHKQLGATEALKYIEHIHDDAWKIAALQWLTKRVK